MIRGIFSSDVGGVILSSDRPLDFHWVIVLLLARHWKYLKIVWNTK